MVVGNASMQVSIFFCMPAINSWKSKILKQYSNNTKKKKIEMLSRNFNYLWNLYAENYKTLVKIKIYINWEMLRTGIGRVDVVNLSVLPNWFVDSMQS